MRRLLVLMLLLSGCTSPPEPATAEGCDEDDAFRTVDVTHANGTHALEVQVVNGVDGTPLAGEPVVVIYGDDEIDSFAMDPFYNRCVVAAGVTDSDGRLTFFLYPDTPYRILHTDETVDNVRKDDYTIEMVNMESNATSIQIPVYPKLVELTWTGTFDAIDPAGTSVTEVRNPDLLPAGSPLIERFDSFSPQSTLTWSNDVLAWGDLYLGLAIGDEEMFTSDFFNDEQGASDTTAEEDSFGQWIDYGRHECHAAEEGLTLVVYDPGPAQAPAARPIEFTWTLTLELVSPFSSFGPSC